MSRISFCFQYPPPLPKGSKSWWCVLRFLIFLVFNDPCHMR